MNPKSGKVALLLVATVAIGIFALPSTVSLFSGQHTWYDLSAGPNDVPCEKCHAEIEDEMQSGDNGAHRNVTCAMCHRTPFTNYTYGSGEGTGSFTPGKEAHAAAVVQCMDCHAADEEDFLGGYPYNHENYPEYYGDGSAAYCYKCHISGSTTGDNAFILAGGFGLTGRNYPTIYVDTGEKAAHRKFVLDAMNESLMEGANEACIACHTRIGVNITWTKNEYLDFQASEDAAGNWSIPSFTAGGTNVTQVNSTNEWTNP
jgi:hypothetical protein